MQYVTYPSVAVLPLLVVALWGILWSLEIFFLLLFFSLQGVWCHHSSISCTLTIKHIILREVPQGSLPGKCDLDQELSFLYGDSPACQVTPRGALENEDIKHCGIPLFSPHRVALKSQSLLILVLTKTKQWMAVCKAFFPFQYIGIIQGISIHMRIMLRASLLI